MKALGIMKPILYYVTENQQKFEEASLILSDIVTLKKFDLEIIEIQGTSQEIIKEKANFASRVVKENFIVEDVSFEMEGLFGFPGPYVKDFLHSIKDSKNLSVLAKKLENNKVKTSCHVALCYLGRFYFFEGSLKGEIVEPRGSLQHGKVSYNNVFLAHGHTKTFGEMSLLEHSKYSHRNLALQQVKDFFIQKTTA